jgi:hypothetical protein
VKESEVRSQKKRLALSLGERVDRDGVFISRRGPGEGLLPSPSKVVF